MYLSLQESKKHLAGLGSLGLGSLITEITANEEDSHEENKNSGNEKSLLNITKQHLYCQESGHNSTTLLRYDNLSRLGEKH